jgi:hypothetical protein
MIGTVKYSANCSARITTICGAFTPMEPISAKDQTESSEAMCSPPRNRVRIVSTPGTCGGRPLIDGHRVTLHALKWRPGTNR